MKSLLKSIDKVINCYSDKYKDNIIDKVIINEIISRYWRINSYPKEALSLREIKEIKSVDYKRIKKMFELDTNPQDYSSGNCVMGAYEYIVRKRDKYKVYSIYYTPQWIVKYIVKRSIEAVTKEEKDISKLKVLEPSCGSGVFLSSIFDILYDMYKKYSRLDNNEIVRRIIEDNLYGIDIDEYGIEISRYTLLSKAYQKIDNKYIAYKFNLKSCDYLKEDKPWDWKFDLALGNPPYLENRGINKYYDKEYLKNNYESAIGRFDIYSLFVEKAIRQVKEKGIVSFVLPTSILSNNNFTVIRRLILSNTNILEIINIGENIFDQVGMNMSIITLEASKQRDIEHRVLCKDISHYSDKIEGLQKSNFKPVFQYHYNNILNNVFDIYSSDTTFRLRERVFQNGYSKINDVCEVIAGVATGNIREKLLTYKDENIYTKRVLEGKDIYQYGYRWSGLFIRYDKSLIDKSKGQYATFMREEFVNNEKILIRQTADRFICTYDNEQIFILNTLYSMIVRNEYKQSIDIKYVLALLNSKFYSYLYRTIVREMGKLFPQVKIFHIQESPIRLISLEDQRKYIDYVESIMDRIKIISKSNTGELERFKTQIEIEEYKKKIDSLVYKLFSLSDREIQEVEHEMGQSPLDYDTSNFVDKKVLIKKLRRYCDIINTSYQTGINPYEIYKLYNNIS